MPVYSLVKDHIFPPVSHAEEDGLLAVGGDLSSGRMLAAYSQGIFPWYNEGETPILWYSPDPRMVLLPSELKVSKSMQQLLNRRPFTVTYDTAFAAVLEGCAMTPRPGQEGTWLGKKLQKAFLGLHALGYAHSVEVWQEGNLVGGLYGLAMGGVFCGESMFARVSNASKYGFISAVRSLQKLGFEMIDCQVHTEHLESLGAREIPRRVFLKMLEKGLEKPMLKGPWTQLVGQGEQELK